MKTLKVKITGVCPLLMHSIRLADRLDPITKQIAAINAKKLRRTESDFDTLRELEWQGGLWLDDQGRPCLPPDAVISCLIAGARKTRAGKDAESGVWCDDPATLDYDGPKDLSALYAEKRFVDYRAVAVQRARVMRTRPRFPTWGATLVLTFDPGVTSEKSVRQWLETAGASCGIGDFRPRFGRFVVEN